MEERFGEIRRLHLVKDPASHAPHKGFAFVDFLDESSLIKAVKEKEIMVKDRLAIIKKSARQIINPPEETEKMKKRDVKKDRKRMIADLIEETVNGEEVKQEIEKKIDESKHIPEEP